MKIMTNNLQNKKIAIVLDYLTAYGGAERVSEEIIKIFPQADIYTSMYWPEYMPEFYKSLKIKTSLLNKFPKIKFLRPILRQASLFIFKYFNLKNYDLIITSTSAPATWIKKTPNQKHISYYHKIISFDREFPNKGIFGWLKNKLSKINREYLKNIDLIITNSKVNALWFDNTYGVKPEVIYPPISLSFNHSKDLAELIEWRKKDYFIFIGRLENYKGIDYIIDACIETNSKLVVVGEGSLSGKLPDSKLVKYLGFVSDEEKLILLQNAKAFIMGSKEDFGIVFAESLICKTPVIGFSEGGINEIVTENKNAILFKEQNKISVLKAIKEFEERREELQKEENYAGIQNKFSIENFKKELLNKIEKIL